MKTLLTSIMIGLLALSPAFASQDQQRPAAGQTQEEGADSRTQAQNNEERDILPRYDPEREVVLDPARPLRAVEVDPLEGYSKISPEHVSADNLRNADVFDPNHQNLGNVDEVLVTQEGIIERVVVNVGGLFGLGAHSVAIDIDEVEIHQDAEDELRVYVPMTEEELREQPEYSPAN
ncbi:PRC-barrel domain-containing protein [Desulfonatronum parangueonense]